MDVREKLPFSGCVNTEEYVQLLFFLVHSLFLTQRFSIGIYDYYLLPQGLYSSVVVVGGNSLLSGFTDRLTKDLSQKTPPVSKIQMVT